MYYTKNFNTVITAMSGLLSILILVLNTLFPQIDKVERIPPILVRNPMAQLKMLLHCDFKCCGSQTDVDSGDGGSDGGGDGGDGGVTHVVENPVLEDKELEML
jgi:hypothetical protein